MQLVEGPPDGGGCGRPACEADPGQGLGVPSGPGGMEVVVLGATQGQERAHRPPPQQQRQQQEQEQEVVQDFKMYLIQVGWEEFECICVREGGALGFFQARGLHPYLACSELRGTFGLRWSGANKRADGSGADSPRPVAPSPEQERCHCTLEDVARRGMLLLDDGATLDVDLVGWGLWP